MLRKEYEIFHLLSEYVIQCKLAIDLLCSQIHKIELFSVVFLVKRWWHIQSAQLLTIYFKCLKKVANLWTRL